MAMNKKGLFFSAIAILIVGLLVIGFAQKIHVPINSNLPIIERRVNILNDYVDSIQNDYVERLVQIGTIRTLESIDSISKFPEVLLKGIDGNESFALNNSLKSLTDISKDVLKIKSNISVLGASIIQDEESGPWNVKVNLSIHLIVDGDVAVWNITTDSISLVSIEGLRDPFYERNGFAHFINKSEIVNGVDSLRKAIQQQTYRFEPFAPSYLNRFRGDAASECCGIESMINPNKMAIKPVNVSYVDYCFFTKKCIKQDGTRNYGEFIFEINNISSDVVDEEFFGFRLDSYHIEELNLSENTGGLCKHISGDEWQDDPGCN